MKEFTAAAASGAAFTPISMAIRMGNYQAPSLMSQLSFVFDLLLHFERRDALLLFVEIFDFRRHSITRHDGTGQGRVSSRVCALAPSRATI